MSTHSNHVCDSSVGFSSQVCLLFYFEILLHVHARTHTHADTCLLGTSSGLFTRHLQNQTYIFRHLFLLHVTSLLQLLPLLLVIIITPEIYYCCYPLILHKSLDWVGNLPRVMQSQGQVQDLKIYWVYPALILLTIISLLQ